jgi:uncharacterized protein with PIN domain
VEIRITFYGNLDFFLHPILKEPPQMMHVIRRSTSVKDGIEACGVPHTEVGTIYVNGVLSDFDRIIIGGDFVDVFPITPPMDVTKKSFLRPDALEMPRFVADVNVGKLASLLRLMGLDTAYEQEWKDSQIAELALREDRIVLTRDRSLLKRKTVVFGHLVRTESPWQQLQEVIDFYSLFQWLQPFSRCTYCNKILRMVSKEAILDQLEPLTRMFYHEFTQCPSCGRVFWPGSHRERIKNRVMNILKKRGKLGLQDNINIGTLFNDM